MADPDLSRTAIVIAGGVGPLAGLMLHRQIIRLTPTISADRHHRDVWHISQVSDMPDRTEYLRGGSQVNPGAIMAANVRDIGLLLASRGRRWRVAVPCATFHAPDIFKVFSERISELEGYVDTVHLVNCTIAELLCSEHSRIGVLSTCGSHAAGVWRSPLLAAGFEVVEPEIETIEMVHAAIYDPGYGLKATEAPSVWSERIIVDACDQLIERAATVLVLGCTELPLLMPALCARYAESVELCDPVQIQAARMVGLKGL